MQHPTTRDRFKHQLKKNLISGLVVVVPLAITAAVIKFVFDIVASVLLPLLSAIFGSVPQYALAPVSVLVSLGFILLVGAMATHALVRKCLTWGETILEYVPLAKTIYQSSKKVVDLFLLHEATPFREVVLIDYPSRGIKMIGFVTGRITSVDGLAYYRVFLPTAPNPASGFLHLFRCDDTVLLDMSVEDAIKYIVSVGMLAPATLEPKSSTDAPPQ